MDYELPYSVFGKLFDKVAFHRTMEKGFEDGLKKLKDTNGEIEIFIDSLRRGFLLFFQLLIKSPELGHHMTVCF